MALAGAVICKAQAVKLAQYSGIFSSAVVLHADKSQRRVEPFDCLPYLRRWRWMIQQQCGLHACFAFRSPTVYESWVTLHLPTQTAVKRCKNKGYFPRLLRGLLTQNYSIFRLLRNLFNVHSFPDIIQVYGLSWELNTDVRKTVSYTYTNCAWLNCLLLWTLQMRILRRV